MDEQTFGAAQIRKIFKDYTASVHSIDINEVPDDAVRKVRVILKYWHILTAFL